jgi:hypothetical protein
VAAVVSHGEDVSLADRVRLEEAVKVTHAAAEAAQQELLVLRATVTAKQAAARELSNAHASAIKELASSGAAPLAADSEDDELMVMDGPEERPANEQCCVQ